MGVAREGFGYAAELLELKDAEDDRARRMLFRQAITSLARGGAGPSALAALDPSALAEAVRTALAHHLFDDLEWLAPQASGLALYELASALPQGQEQRELGRRLLGRLYAANASTFAIVAARMASGSIRGLLSPAVRARVALLVEVPLSEGIPDGPLALAILSRRELARAWIERASTSSLPSRRLAARLLERAAREATVRAAQGETHALKAFQQENILQALVRLLADREPLVWRYAATARGLLAPYVPDFRAALETAMDPALTPTEWRRVATSVVALTATDPKSAELLLPRMIPLFERDRGMAGALVWGLPRAAEAEEALAHRWLDLALSIDPFASAEAMCDFLADYGQESFTEPAVRKTLAAVQRLAAASTQRSLADALLQEFRRDLGELARPVGTLRAELGEALDRYATDGAPAAFAAARNVLDSAAGAVSVLSGMGAGDAAGKGRELEMRATANVLRDVGTSLLERHVLGDLIQLGTKPSEVIALRERLEVTRESLTEWLLTEEQSNDVVNVAVSLRRVKALLHLADGDVDEGDDRPPGSSSPDDLSERAERAALRSKRWMRIAETLLRRTRGEPPPQLRRVLLAGLARACDGYVRDDDGDLVEVFLVLASALDEPLAFDTLASASTTPDLVFVLHGYAQFLRLVQEAFPRQIPSSTGSKHDSLMPPALKLATPAQLTAWLQALQRLAVEYVADLSQKSAALQTLLLRVHRALDGMMQATSLESLRSESGSEDVVVELETALLGLQKLTLPALRRFRIDGDVLRAQTEHHGEEELPLSTVLARMWASPAGQNGALRDDVVHRAAHALGRGLPRAIADLVAAVYGRLLTLRRARIERQSGRFQALAPLPSWLPARRTLGGFYLLRPLGAGGSGSVFLACRVEERYDADAERFALKVPEYSETAARTLSEAEFLEMFRAEATALLALPKQGNLAKFVTFDAGAKPKPILVMEYVEGPTAEHALETKSLDTARALRILDELLAGVEAMHSVGLGHLDVKPSNLILRTQAGQEQAVLVDFGLSGRTLRPGCATGPYGAPEVWTSTALDEIQALKPQPVDVYAAAAVAFELLTGTLLFDAGSELEIVTKHLSHDGAPEGLVKLARHPRMQEVAELLCSALRRDPTRRIAIGEFRTALKRLSKKIAAEPWPISLSAPSSQ